MRIIKHVGFRQWLCNPCGYCSRHFERGEAEQRGYVARVVLILHVPPVLQREARLRQRFLHVVLTQLQTEKLLILEAVIGLSQNARHHQAPASPDQ